MPVSLKFPKSEIGLPALKVGKGAVVDGVYGREKCKELIESKDVSRTALLHTVMICFCLYAGFWFQFVTQLMYNEPSVYVLTGGAWVFGPFSPDTRFYLPCSDGVPFSLAEIFAFLSIFGLVMALIYGWHFTQRAQEKWRMRLAIIIFGLLIGGWSVAGLVGEEGAWAELENTRERILSSPDYGQAHREHNQILLLRIDERLAERPEK